MCGIAGYISDNPEKNGEKIVNRMLDKIRHRGPDQKGVATYDNVTLGMVRLSIVDKKTHEIPYEDPLGKAALVYNGEIYNHEDLRTSLKGVSFKSCSDAETVLFHFIRHGSKAWEHYNGMYAFCIYDRLDKILYLVRDKTGEKPLYYYQGKDFFAFSSEIKALAECCPLLFNKNNVSYRTYEFTVGRETLFKDIYQLQPGEYLRYKDRKITLHNYWKIWDKLIEVRDNRKKILSDLTELLEDSILLRTRNCAHQYGVFISGGVDSALIACLAKPDYLYTCHYELGPDFDELKYAKLVAKKINRDLVVVEPSPEDFQRVRKKIIFHLDTPCTWTSFSLWMLLERAKQDLRVIMSGEGADEIFAGYHRYHLLNHDEQIKNLEAMKQYSYLIQKYYGSPAERYAKLVNRCENQYDAEVIKYLHSTISSYFEKVSHDVIHAMGLNDFYSTMQVLLQMSDRMAMAFSIENRSPYLDYRLVQYAYSMPSKYKIYNGVTKWILKEIAKKFIPPQICERIDKRGFSAPLNRWFGWDKKGQYDRSIYREIVFEDWKKVFNV